MILLLFGDSITLGLNDTEGGWAARLRKHIEQKVDSFKTHNVEVYNLGVSGDTSRELSSRVESEIIPRIVRADTGEKIIVIFAIGINDSKYLVAEETNAVSQEEFQKNLEAMVGVVKKYTNIIHFLGLTPVDESRTTPVSWNANKMYKNEYVKRYNNCIQTSCYKMQISFIDIYHSWMKENYVELLDDGLHPNAEGHKKIFEAIQQKVTIEEINTE